MARLLRSQNTQSPRKSTAAFGCDSLPLVPCVAPGRKRPNFQSQVQSKVHAASKSKRLRRLSQPEQAASLVLALSAHLDPPSSPRQVAHHAALPPLPTLRPAALGSTQPK